MSLQYDTEMALRGALKALTNLLIGETAVHITKDINHDKKIVVLPNRKT